VIAALVLPVGAAADPIAITNFGFEDISGQTVFNEFTFGTPAGWSFYDPNNIFPGGGVFIGTLQPNGVEFFDSLAPEGVRVAILFARDQLGLGEYGYTQVLAENLAADTQYELTVQVGNIASGTAESTEFFNLDEFPGYRVELRAGGQVIAMDDNSLDGLIPEGEFAVSVVSLSVGESHPQLGQPLAIRLVNLNLIPDGFNAGNSPDLEVDFDDVQLTAVPDDLLFDDGFEAP
jgi:hypothetical protein